MGIPIYIPSRSRVDRMGVLEQLSDNRLYDTHIIVPESQHPEYEKKITDEWNEPLPVVIPTPDYWKIGEVRQSCALHAYNNGHRHFLMIDDDIRFLIRQDIDDWRLREASIEEVDSMIEWMHLRMINTRGLTLTSVSPREGNNRPGVGGPDDLFVMQQRIHRVYMWNVDEFLKLEHLRVTVAEDFDLALQTLRRGNQIGMSYYWGQGQRTTQDTGGASDYRTLEVHNASVQRLAELHPGFVRVVDKQNKSGGELASRKESVISWQAAAEEGMRTRFAAKAFANRVVESQD